LLAWLLRVVVVVLLLMLLLVVVVVVLLLVVVVILRGCMLVCLGCALRSLSSGMIRSDSRERARQRELLAGWRPAYQLAPDPPNLCVWPCDGMNAMLAWRVCWAAASNTQKPSKQQLHHPHHPFATRGRKQRLE
jgi:hypothetical protein